MGLDAKERQLCDLIGRRRDALLADLALHVGLPTGPGGDAIDETRERFTERLERLGATTELVPGVPKPDWLRGTDPDGPIPPTAVCRRDREGTPRVLIAGHLDTVHDVSSPFRALTVAPDGKTATGPGCVDMKGGLVIAVAALEALEEAGIEASWSFLMNADEETGTYHSEPALRAEASRHDFGIAIEPALPGGELAIERMGSGQFMIECRGRSAHVGRAFVDGVSAVTALGRAIVRVSEIADPAAGRIVNVGPLECNTPPNVVPPLAKAWGNARYPTPEIGEEVGALLDAIGTGEDAMPATIIRRSFNRPAKPLIPETERLALAARAAAEDLGQSLPFAKTGGVCDGNTLQDAGLPTIDTLGVRGGGLHTSEEWIELASLVERCQLLAVLVARLASGRIGLDPPR